MYVTPDGELAGICEHPGNYGAISGYDNDGYGYGGGLGYAGAHQQPYGLSGIFGGIGKAFKAVGKGIGKVASTVGKGVAKGAVFAAKNVGKVAPLVSLVPGVGTVAGAVIGGAGKAVSAIARKKPVAEAVQDIAVGAGTGALIAEGRQRGGAFLKQRAAARTAASVKDALIAAGTKRGFGGKLPLPGTTDSSSTIAPPMILPHATPDGDVTPRAKKRGGGLFDTVKGLISSGRKTITEKAADAVVEATGTAAGGIPFSGGGGSAPAVTADAAAPEVAEAGMLSGNMMPLLLIGGAALMLTQGGGGRRARR